MCASILVPVSLVVRVENGPCPAWSKRWTHIHILCIFFRYTNNSGFTNGMLLQNVFSEIMKQVESYYIFSHFWCRKLHENKLNIMDIKFDNFAGWSRVIFTEVKLYHEANQNHHCLNYSHQQKMPIIISTAMQDNKNMWLFGNFSKLILNMEKCSVMTNSFFWYIRNVACDTISL